MRFLVVIAADQRVVEIMVPHNGGFGLGLGGGGGGESDGGGTGGGRRRVQHPRARR